MRTAKLSIKNKIVRVLSGDGSFDFSRDHCNAVVIQNAGDVSVKLNDNWTFLPGAILHLGSQTDENQYADEIRVRFDTETSGVNPRVEAFPLAAFTCLCERCKKA